MRSPRKKPQWIAAIVGFFVGLIATVIVLGMTSADESAATALGRVFAPVLLTIIAMLLLMRSSPLWFRAVWVLAFAGLTLGASGLGLMVREDARQKRLFERTVEDSMEETQQWQTLLSDPDRIPEPRPRPQWRKEDGKYAQASLVFRTAMWERFENKRQHRIDMKQAGWQQAISPEELQKPGARERVAQRVAAARAAIDLWNRRELATSHDFLRKLRATELPADFREGFEARAGGEDVDRIVQDAAEQERDIIDAVEQHAYLMLSMRWELQDGVVMFYKDSDIARFDASRMALMRATQKAQQHQREAETRLRETVLSLRR